MVSRFIVGRTMGSPGNEMNSRTLPKPVTVNHQAYGGKQLRLAFPEIVCLTASQLLGTSTGSVKQAHDSKPRLIVVSKLQQTMAAAQIQPLANVGAMIFDRVRTNTQSLSDFLARKIYRNQFQ